ITDADGSNTWKAWEGGPSANVDDPAWSPDARRIAFSYNTGSGYDIWVWNACTASAAVLVSGSTADMHPSWQPVLPVPTPLPACSSASPTPTTSPSSSTSSSSSSSSTSTSSTSPPPPTPPAGRHVGVADAGFDPQSVRIARGEFVIWDGEGPST